MRINEKGEIIITREKGAEMFLVLSAARIKLNGKMRTWADKYWKEFETVFGLNCGLQ